ncbi:isoprenyl transferase [Planctomycetota bacterium]|nr:isoprenyl transferase [Planctomycetota bacterium]
MGAPAAPVPGTPDRHDPAQAAIAAGLDPARMPRHVGVIMDGNGRWAERQGRERIDGHRRGVEAVRTVVTESVRLAIPRVTLYAFSSENWSRPRREVDFLMLLLADFLRSEEPTLHANRVRLEAIGRLDRLPAEVQYELDRVRAATAHYDRNILSLALSYGGRDELVDACRRIASQVAAGELAAAAIDAATIQANLYTPEAADLDVVIRTAGELRLSNFLPWQAVYAEYVVTEVLWPDFGVTAYHDCLRDFQGRERRFGGL